MDSASTYLVTYEVYMEAGNPKEAAEAAFLHLVQHRPDAEADYRQFTVADTATEHVVTVLL